MSDADFRLSADYLRTYLTYCPETGVFHWIKAKARAKAGDAAGTISRTTGYLSIGIGGFFIGAHRLALLYSSGVMPTGHVDHIDGNRVNNRLSNLREVTNKMNCENRKGPQRDNKLGVLGVTRSGRGFAATIRHHGKRTWLGTFDTAEEAHAAYLARKRLIHEGNTL